MNVDKFGRAHHQKIQIEYATANGLQLTNDNQFNIENKRLTNVADPVDGHNAMTLQYYLKTRHELDGNRLKNVADPEEDDDVRANSVGQLDKYFKRKREGKENEQEAFIKSKKKHKGSPQAEKANNTGYNTRIQKEEEYGRNGTVIRKNGRDKE
ncbi:hypothetical protein FQR65_LT04169 [Abscondita terminalis]|nr:hypothetical protein FQR65_LT04169 [Abscondita terminalis]